MDLLERKGELERYFKSVQAIGVLPHYADAFKLYQEYSEFGNYPYNGGYYDQPALWREDMSYVSAEIEYVALNDDIQEAQTRLNELLNPNVSK